MDTATDVGAFAAQVARNCLVADAGVSLGAIVGDPEGHLTLLKDLEQRQLAAAIAHELGELAEDRRRRGAWEALLLRARGTRAEMPARALKDALADAGDGGLLQRLIARRDRAGLALWAAAGPWLLRKFLPEARACGPSPFYRSSHSASCASRLVAFATIRT